MTRNGRGFTLVEVLVVLVIASLVSVLLFQMLGQTLRIRGRFAEQLSESQTGRMRADWLRHALQSLQTEPATSAGRFQGRADALSGPSAAPIGGGAPAVRPIRLEWQPRDGGWVLAYEDERGRWLLWEAAAAERPGFAYLDEQGQSHAQWPPPGTPPPAGLAPAGLPPAAGPAAASGRSSVGGLLGGSGSLLGAAGGLGAGLPGGLAVPAWPQLPVAVVVHWTDAGGRRQARVAAIAGEREPRRPTINLFASP